MEDSSPQDGSCRPEEAKAMAALLRARSLLEIHCYDDRGRDQGTAALSFRKWVDEKELLFEADFLKASDEYYDWWAKNVMDPGRTVYHLCTTVRHRCRVTGIRGEDVIHVTKWRLSSPQALIGQGYASVEVERHFEESLNELLASRIPRGVPPAGPPRRELAEVPRHQTGLDAALGGEDVDVNAELAEIARQAHLGRGAPDPAERRGAKKESFSQLLLSRAKGHEESRGRKRSRSERGTHHGGCRETTEEKRKTH